MDLTELLKNDSSLGPAGPFFIEHLPAVGNPTAILAGSSFPQVR
jgi:hypothetical protein